MNFSEKNILPSNSERIQNDTQNLNEIFMRISLSSEIFWTSKKVLILQFKFMRKF